MGKWLKANGEAIYGTRMTTPNEDGAFAFTKKEGVTYALMRLNENETLPEKVEVGLNTPHLVHTKYPTDTRVVAETDVIYWGAKGDGVTDDTAATVAIAEDGNADGVAHEYSSLRSG